jgi:hypothetical protein
MHTHINEIILYQPDSAIKMEVRLENETVWLSLEQMVHLFQRDKSTVSRHIKNIFDEQELDQMATVANFATVQIEGGRNVERMIEFYNLDVIISVGYRVKSKQGTQFRQWANRVLKEYLLKGYAVNQRFERIEQQVLDTNRRLEKTEEKVDYHIGASLKDLGKKWGNFAIANCDSKNRRPEGRQTDCTIRFYGTRCCDAFERNKFRTCYRGEYPDNACICSSTAICCYTK